MSLPVLFNTVVGVVQSVRLRLRWDAQEPGIRFKVYQGTSSGQYGSATEVQTNSHEVLVGSGTHYFAVSALDQANNESPLSEEKSQLVDLTPPAAPTGLQIEVLPA